MPHILALFLFPSFPLILPLNRPDFWLNTTGEVNALHSTSTSSPTTILSPKPVRTPPTLPQSEVEEEVECHRVDRRG